MARFKDKVALVTGAGGGIGAAVAERLGREQARLVLAVRHSDPRQDAANGPRWSGSPGVVSMTCDVRVESEAEACCQAAIEAFGRLDVVVNNAGVMSFAPIEAMNAEVWLDTLKVDLLGCAFFIKHGLKRMRPGGAIVNIASIHALQTTRDAGAYAASKAGAVSLTRTAAIEAAERGVRVNAILPGAIDTPMLWDNPNVRSGLERIDPKMVGQPEDVAAAVAFLASSEARFVNGTSLVVDGGRMAAL